MVDNSLIASEGTRLGKIPGGASRHVGGGLVITEAGEHRIRAGKVVVQASVKLRFVQGVVPVQIVSRRWQRIESDHLRSNGITRHGRRNLVASAASRHLRLAPS